VRDYDKVQQVFRQITGTEAFSSGPQLNYQIHYVDSSTWHDSERPVPERYGSTYAQTTSWDHFAYCCADLSHTLTLVRPSTFRPQNKGLKRSGVFRPRTRTRS
jgi:hypothetical protein